MSLQLTFSVSDFGGLRYFFIASVVAFHMPKLEEIASFPLDPSTIVPTDSLVQLGSRFRNLFSFPQYALISTTPPLFRVCSMFFIRKDAACAASEFLCDLVAFLHDDISLETESVLRHLGFLVMRPGIPVELDEIDDKARGTGSSVERRFEVTYDTTRVCLPPPQTRSAKL